MKNLSDICMVAAGAQHSLALRSDGIVFAWGSNARGELGVGPGDYADVPQPINGLDRVITIAACGGTSVAVADDGSLYSWGNNSQGKLGHGSERDVSVPRRVPGVRVDLISSVR